LRRTCPWCLARSKVADERVCEVDLSGGLVAVTLEGERQPAFVN
jgi:hypothetical protein